MPQPLLYELNTRCWLRQLAVESRRPATLATVPDSQLKQWAQWGFTHIWLMGVWTGGPRARAEALAAAGQRRAYAEALPGWTEADVTASPYAIADYTVAESLGGEAGLSAFRRRLHDHGLKLVLDFVPNHLGLDHPWVQERPKLFVQLPNVDAKSREAFLQPTTQGQHWLAHGKDPYFPAWTDTVQLDYRRAETRQAMADLLASVAERCDGLRCDMAMLLLNDVFANTWSAVPTPEPVGPEFWPTAIARVKRTQPDFLFLAEAYWGTEARLQAQGFDYTYDKVLYDKLVTREPAGVQSHLFSLPREQLAAGAHFLENHDEPRVASMLSLPEHRAAALVVLGLPGLRLLHEGQLEGATRRLPVQLQRRDPEPVQANIRSWYEQVLAAFKQSAVGHSEFALVRPQPAWPDNPTHGNFVLVRWGGRAPEFDLVVVNLAAHRSQCNALLELPPETPQWTLQDRLGTECYLRSTKELQRHGLYLDLPAHGAQLFSFAPA